MKTISLSETTFVTVLEGSTNDDTLRGNSKDNTLIGGDGDDSLAGRGGYDQLIGGRGSDTFVITDEPCDVTILDFETGASHDQLNLRIFPSITSMEALEQRMTSGSVIIDIDDMHRVTIANLIQEEVFDPRYFLLSEGADEARDKGDDECGWFAYSRPECVDTILSIVLGIVGVAGLGVGAWQFSHNFLKRGQKPTGAEEKGEKEMDPRKRSVSDTRDSRKRRYLETKTERRVLGSDFVQGLQEEKPSGDESGSRGRVEDAAASDLSFLSYL
uniref:Peptidase M10 serralysin C-terminal domain-containing protein n=1 Tax=Vitrella brassicaformis TaxID=1169539 RepID=A0A6U4HHW2_9ALVE|mmetsp:Transcript_49305/g.123586  ORF Transcript_49305/g.123586 Transcript_49305/m.123586 type:complete len:272 (+) Transcript_49305:482-1297(+)